MLSGNIRGDGDIGGTLSISRGAHWEGQVRARSAVIAGALTGSIEVTGQLEVGAAAVIKGQVTARTLAIRTRCGDRGRNAGHQRVRPWCSSKKSVPRRAGLGRRKSEFPRNEWR